MAIMDKIGGFALCMSHAPGITGLGYLAAALLPPPRCYNTG